MRVSINISFSSHVHCCLQELPHSCFDSHYDRESTNNFMNELHVLFRLFSRSRKLNAHFLIFTGKESLRRNHKQEPKLSFLVKALYTMATALQRYRDDICGKEIVGVCPRLQKSFNHSIFYVRKCS